MNICILIGKIIDEIEFKFIIKSKNKSIAYFNIELLNKSVIKVKAHNLVADFVYSNYRKNQIIAIEGEIREDGAVELLRVYENKL